MIENKNFKSSKEWLKNIIQKKMDNNPSYSVRAFCKYVGLSPSYITRVLNGSRPLTIKSSLKICDMISSSPEERSHLFSMIAKENNKLVNFQKVLKQDELSELNLSVDAFHIISDWYHYAIGQLFFIDGFKEEVRWIASKLGISMLEVKMALERMERLGIIRQNKQGKLERAKKTISTTDGVYSPGLRKFHRQILLKAIDALEEIPLDERSITSITMAINEEKMKEAMKEITKFRKKMCKFLEKGKKTRVYNLNINLIPLSKKLSEDK